MRTARILCATGLAASMAAPALAENVVTYGSWGGAYQEAVRKAIIDPIEAEHGLTVKDAALSTGIADIRTRVRGGANDLDVVELFGGQCAQAAEEGLLVELDYDRLPNAAGVPEELRDQHWIGFTAYSSVLAWNTEVYGDNPPGDWADFFDVEGFPGTRALPGYNGQAVLEAALMADGVPRDQIYPLDIDRAYARLAELKPDVDVWWTSGSQAMQLATSQESDMLMIWAARIEAAIAEGAPYAYTLDNAVMDVECLVIPRDSPNPEGAMELVNLMLAPEYQANLPALIPYGPMNADAFKTGKISPEDAERVVTSEANRARQVILSAPYWAEHGQALQERWDAFMQQ